MGNRKRAKELLVHYIRWIYLATNQYWGHDNQAEVESIVDYIIDAAIAETTKAIAETMKDVRENRA